MNSHPYSHPFKFAYVYALITADCALIKLGKATNRSHMSARLAAHRRYFLFNLFDSFCFRFENSYQALHAEQALLFELRPWIKEFDHRFPGYTEYFIGTCRNDISRLMLNQKRPGFVSMEHISDELELEDYEMPDVTIHATPAYPYSRVIS